MLVTRIADSQTTTENSSREISLSTISIRTTAETLKKSTSNGETVHHRSQTDTERARTQTATKRTTTCKPDPQVAKIVAITKIVTNRRTTKNVRPDLTSVLDCNLEDTKTRSTENNPT